MTRAGLRQLVEQAELSIEHEVAVKDSGTTVVVCA